MRVEVVEHLVVVQTVVAPLAVAVLLGFFSCMSHQQAAIPDVAVRSAYETQDWLHARRMAVRGRAW